MGKLYNSMIGGVIISAAMYIFHSVGFEPTSLFLLLLNPTNFENSRFYGFLGIAGFATIAGFITIGIAAVIRQDWLLRGGIIASISSLVIFPYVDLFRIVVGHTTYISPVCVGSPVCEQLNTIGGIGQVIGLVIVGPMILYSMWACLNYVWTGEQ